MRDKGSASLELSLLAPVVIGLLLLVVYAGRTVQAEADVAHAAYEAARTASLVGDPTNAIEAAIQVVQANLAQGTAACQDLDISVDTSLFAPGGQVTVTVTCVSTYEDLSLLAVPGTRQFVANATEVIDTFRAGPP